MSCTIHKTTIKARLGRDLTRHEELEMSCARVEQAQREQQILDIAIKVMAGDPSQVGHYNQRKKEIQLDEPYLAAKIKAAIEIAEDILDHHLQRKSNALYDSDLGFLRCYQREQDELRQAQGPQREDPALEAIKARRDEQNATPGSIEVKR